MLKFATIISRDFSETLYAGGRKATVSKVTVIDRQLGRVVEWIAYMTHHLITTLHFKMNTQSNFKCLLPAA